MYFASSVIGFNLTVSAVNRPLGRFYIILTETVQKQIFSNRNCSTISSATGWNAICKFPSDAGALPHGFNYWNRLANKIMEKLWCQTPGVAVNMYVVRDRPEGTDLAELPTQLFNKISTFGCQRKNKFETCDLQHVVLPPRVTSQEQHSPSSPPRSWVFFMNSFFCSLGKSVITWCTE